MDITGGASIDAVGGSDSSGGNVIANNLGNGVSIDGSTTIGNQVKANWIGTDQSSTANMGNVEDGVIISGGTTLNTIGGSASSNGNVIVSNTLNGVEIAGANQTANTVAANYIGTDQNTTAGLGNQQDGVLISNAAFELGRGQRLVARSSKANVIAGNEGNGVHITAPQAGGTSWRETTSAPDDNGYYEIGNNGDGVLINGGTVQTRSGSTTLPEARRTSLSGNGHNGVRISGSGTSSNVVAGNYIEITPTDTAEAICREASGSRKRPLARTLSAAIPTWPR